jgi:hypothetical protein
MNKYQQVVAIRTQILDLATAKGFGPDQPHDVQMKGLEDAELVEQTMELSFKMMPLLADLADIGNLRPEDHAASLEMHEALLAKFQDEQDIMLNQRERLADMNPEFVDELIQQVPAMIAETERSIATIKNRMLMIA